MGVDVRYRIVDVFTDRPLSGNALCVVLDPVPEPVMRAIAREVNLSETTFPVVVDDGEYEVRIFTPGGELPFAGHPTLGTAWVLGERRWVQRSAGATVVVEADADGAWMTQPAPELTALDDGAVERVVEALGLSRAEGAWRAEAGGTAHLVVPTTAGIARLEPDLRAVAACAASARTSTVAVARRVDDGTLHARVFVPGLGIPEDPGTGSAAGPIALLGRQVLGTGVDVTIEQGVEIGRRCEMHVHAEPGAVRVGGAVAACAEGRFTL